MYSKYSLVTLNIHHSQLKCSQYFFKGRQIIFQRQYRRQKRDEQEVEKEKEKERQESERENGEKEEDGQEERDW